MAQRRRLLDRMAASGLDHVMVGDHVVFHGGIGNDGLADAASVVTAREDLDVYLAVYLLSLRHPLLVARQLVTVAQFAPGRLSLGLGIGGATSHYCLSNAFRAGDATLVVPLDFMRIPLIAVVGWAFYSESLDVFVLIGALIIICGVIWNLRAESARARPA